MLKFIKDLEEGGKAEVATAMLARIKEQGA